MAKMTELEKMTFENVIKVMKLYEDCGSDHEKLYHLSNALSLLDTLKTFLNSKMELMNRGHAGKTQHIEVNVTGSGDIKPANGNGEKK